MKAYNSTVTCSRLEIVALATKPVHLSTSLPQKNPQLPNMEFGRRLSVEKEIEKASALSLANACETTPTSY